MSKRMETKLPIVGIIQFRMWWQWLYLSRARLWECCLGVEEKCEKLDCCLLFVISPFKLYLQRVRVENWCQNSHLVNVDCTIWKALSHPNFQGRHSKMDFEPTNHCNFKPLRNTHGHWMWLARSPQKRKILTKNWRGRQKWPWSFNPTDIFSLFLSNPFKAFLYLTPNDPHSQFLQRCFHLLKFKFIWLHFWVLYKKLKVLDQSRSTAGKA